MGFTPLTKKKVWEQDFTALGSFHVDLFSLVLKYCGSWPTHDQSTILNLAINDFVINGNVKYLHQYVSQYLIYTPLERMLQSPQTQWGISIDNIY